MPARPPIPTRWSTAFCCLPDPRRTQIRDHPASNRDREKQFYRPQAKNEGLRSSRWFHTKLCRSDTPAVLCLPHSEQPPECHPAPTRRPELPATVRGELRHREENEPVSPHAPGDGWTAARPTPAPLRQTARWQKDWRLSDRGAAVREHSMASNKAGKDFHPKLRRR